MSTLEGAGPIGLGITKLRLWDELHRAHCDSFSYLRQESSNPSKTKRPFVELGNTLQETRAITSPNMLQPVSYSPQHGQDGESPGKRRRNDADTEDTKRNDSSSHRGLQPVSQSCIPDWFMANCGSKNAPSVGASRRVGPARDCQGVLIPPPPPKPGPSRRKPPPLVSRIKAKARRAKRKQQKAEYRRRLFLSHMVQATQTARQHKAIDSKAAAANARPTAREVFDKKLSMFPERLGVDLASFVEIVFDTDAQSTEVTDPSDISDDDLARATRSEIDTRKKLGGADVNIPPRVYRWMVARDFAERWPQKVRGVQKNPWPGLEDVWGLPTDVVTGAVVAKQRVNGDGKDEEPMRWQSGRRSRFIRRK